MSDMFVDALRYPSTDRARVDGTAMYLVALLVGGTLLRLAAQFWPGLTFLAPTLAAIVPLVIFLNLVGGMLVGDGFPSLATTKTSRPVGRVVGATSIYLFPVAVIVVAVDYMTATGSIPAMLTGVTTAISATVTLFVTVICAYLLPAMTAVSTREGLRAGLRQDILRGTTSGTYFFAWMGTAVPVVLAWSALTTTISRSVAALPTLNWCAYAHVATTALVAEGVSRAIP